jgi:hypothetical protein
VAKHSSAPPQFTILIYDRGGRRIIGTASMHGPGEDAQPGAKHSPAATRGAVLRLHSSRNATDHEA